MPHLTLAVLLLTAAPHRTKVAVLDLIPVTDAEAPAAKLLTAVMVNEVSKSGDFEVLSTADIRGMISLERQKQLMGCSDNSSCLAELGGALGADYMINGQIGKLGNRYRLDLRLIDTVKSRVLASQGDFVTGTEDALGDATLALTHKLLVEGHLVGLEAPPPATPPVGALTTTTSSSAGSSRLPAYLSLGAAGLLAVGALVATLETRSTYTTAQNCYATGKVAATCQAGDSSLKWSGPVADALWAGTIVAAGVSTYFFLRPDPPSSGAGGELGVGGRF